MAASPPSWWRDTTPVNAGLALKKQAVEHYLRFVKEFPNDDMAAIVYLQVADYCFDNDLFFEAKKNYWKVTENPQTAQYPYALFTLGYVYYNLEEYEESLASFKAVLKTYEQGQITPEAKKRPALRKRTLSAMVHVFAKIPDGTSRASRFFTQLLGQKAAAAYLESLKKELARQRKER